MLCHGVSVPPQSKMTALTAMLESYAPPAAVPPGQVVLDKNDLLDGL
jgi:hypothetical protein